MDAFEKWTVALACGGLIINLVLVIGALIQLHFLRSQLAQTRESVQLDHDRRRMQATLEFYSGTIEHRANLLQILPSLYDERLAAVIADPSKEEVREIRKYLGYWETFATGANTGTLDVSVISRLTGSRIRRVWGAYEDYIEDRRAALDNPTLYIELETLARELEARRPDELRKLGSATATRASL